MSRQLPTDYQQFIATGKYARWIEEEKRRETWDETVDRYISFFRERSPDLPDDVWADIRNHILALDVMPSMRCLMTAGKPLTGITLLDLTVHIGLSMTYVHSMK